MKQHAVIVAGGRGTRMKSDVPKQFLILAGKPILLHTLEAFYQFNPSLSIWVVLPSTEHDRWNQLCKDYQCAVPHQVISGGTYRPESVRNGVLCIEDNNSLVAVHDGVRPLVSPNLIKQSFEVAERRGSAIVSVKLKDSIREITEEGSVSRERDNYRLMQTPQTFRTSWLRKAYEVLDSLREFRDEASLVEAIGKKVTLIDGDNRNIKVTTPEDMQVAEAFLLQKASL